MPIVSTTIALERFSTFGDLLKYLRRRAGYTQRQLSIQVGYSDAQISRLEQNERLPDLATITARFIPVLDLEDEPDIAARLLELAAEVRREDAPASGLAPYKGLLYFDESDAEWFFGREDLTKQLFDHLHHNIKQNNRFLAIVGASGSGKSSVIRAGLVPALRWHQSSASWPVTVITPTAHPLVSLAAGIGSESRHAGSIRNIAEDLPRKPELLSEIMGQSVKTIGASHALLIVDQFEELFTLCQVESEQVAFINSLLAAACSPGSVAVVVIVLRADFYAQCGRFENLRQVLAQHQEYIGPMSKADLRKAIEEPAHRGHWEFEPGLVDLLLHDVGAEPAGNPEPGALPLLEHALFTTWQRRRGRTLTLSGYTASGGVGGAIAETAEAVFYDQLEPDQRNIARQIFLRLTELGGDASLIGTRRRVNFDELISKPEERQSVQDVLVTLADTRLITTDQDTAEVAHEALIREWPTLRGWLEENREYLRLHRKLADAAQDWDLHGRDEGSLYRGSKLTTAIEWSGSHSHELNALEREFLDASIDLAAREAHQVEAQRERELVAAHQLAESERSLALTQKRMNTRLRRLAVILAVALLLVGILAFEAFSLSTKAVRSQKLATSRELSAAAVTNLDVDPERSVLLALAALDQADTLEARNALHQALPELHIQQTLSAHRQSPGLAYSPDGKRLASIGVDGDAYIWDVTTGERLHSLHIENGIPGFGIDFSPDGKLLAAAWADRVTVWNADDGEIKFSLTGDLNMGTIDRIRFSPNSKFLAIAYIDGLPRVFTMSTGELALSLQGHGNISDAIDYSPDGALLATGDQAGVVMIWDANTGKELITIEQNGMVHDLSFSPDGLKLATANEDGTLAIWDPFTGDELLRLPRLSGMYGVTFMPDNRRLITSHQDGTARVWDSYSGQLLLTLAGHVSTVVDVASSPDGTQIATSGYDGTVRIWDAAPGSELLTIPTSTDQVWDVTYSPNGKNLASVSIDGSLNVHEAITGRKILELNPGSPLTSLAFSPNGDHIAAGGMDGSLFVWEYPSGEILMQQSGHQGLVSGISFSPDGNRLVSSAWDGTRTIWDLATTSPLISFSTPAGLGAGISFSPGGEYIFSGSADGYIRQWDSQTGQQVQEFNADGREVYGLAVSPDGKLLAAGLQDGKIDLWDIARHEKVNQLTGHSGLVLRLAFNQDGTRLASASFDRLAKVWDVASGNELYSLYGNTGNVFGAAFSPDSASLATVGADGTLRTFLADIPAVKELAMSKLTRTLTDEECRVFLHQQKCP